MKGAAAMAATAPCSVGATAEAATEDSMERTAMVKSMSLRER